MQRALRAIVIEDMDFCREILTEFLEDRGYQVLGFSDVTGCPLFPARQARCSHEYACTDLLLLDNRMPHMNGLDFLELHQQGSCLVHMENIAVLSAEWSAGELNRAEQVGCKTFHKPYDFAVLSNWLDKVEKRIPRARILQKTEVVMSKRFVSKNRPC